MGFTGVKLGRRILNQHILQKYSNHMLSSVLLTVLLSCRGGVRSGEALSEKRVINAALHNGFGTHVVQLS